MTDATGIPFQESPSVTNYSPISEALEELRNTLARKSVDYSVGSSAFSNFVFASGISGVPPRDIMLSQIGIKLGRIQSVMQNESWEYESLEDSIKDLAGYAVILFAYTREMVGAYDG